MPVKKNLHFYKVDMEILRVIFKFRDMTPGLQISALQIMNRQLISQLIKTQWGLSLISNNE